MMRRIVDLPAPLSPRIPIFAPGKKLSEMSLRICALRRHDFADAMHRIDVLGHASNVSHPFGEGLPVGRRRLVVSTVAITTILGILDGTISNVALPTIAQDLQVSSAAVVWVVNAFALATTMCCFRSRVTVTSSVSRASIAWASRSS